MELFTSTFASAVVENKRLLALIEEDKASRIKHGQGFSRSRERCQKIINTLECRDTESNQPGTHHLQHAISAYLQSGYSSASILVMDGYDDLEKYSIAIFKANGKKIEQIKIYPKEFSLGCMYSMATDYCGLEPSNGLAQPGKLMGLATYCSRGWYPGNLRFLEVDQYTGEILPCSFGLSGLFEVFKKEVGLEKAKNLSFEYAEVAKLAQRLFERSVFSLLRFMRNTLPSKNLIISGGCGLNCTTNGIIARSKEWNDIFIPPMCEDVGNILGAIYLTSGLELSEPLVYNISPTTNYKVDKCKIDQDTVADWIRQGTPIAWFEGGSEYGPRALGHRSIIANAELPWMKYYINELKGREHWRPLAPVVLDCYFRNLFRLCHDLPRIYKYMLATEEMKSEYRSIYPSVLSPDGTTRPQVLYKEKENVTLYNFMADHGMPVLMNTSMNGKDEPICETIEDAKRFCAKTLIPLVLVQDGNMYLVNPFDQGNE